MSDQPKDAAGAPAEAAEKNEVGTAPETNPVPEGKPAFAALQEAVKAAERQAAAKVEDRGAGEKPAQAAVSKTKPSPAPAAASPKPSHQAGAYHPAAQAAALAIALGLGGASGWSASVLSSVARSRMEPPPAAETTSAAPVVDRGGAAFGIRLTETDNVRLATEMRAMRATVDGLNDALERARQDQTARIAQVSDRLERASRTEQDLGQKLASLSERLERGDRDGSAKVAERLERIERQVVSAAPPAATAAPVRMASAPPEMPAQTGSINPRPNMPEAKPVLPPLEGWVLRDVDSGVALIENRKRRLVEIAPGDIVPGTGSRVEAIEKRGKNWVVITAKGTITAQP